MKVKYRCGEHGIFTLEFAQIGGRSRWGGAPDAPPCPACEQPAERVHRRSHGLSVPAVMFGRIKAYCARAKISLAQFVVMVTRDPETLADAADRVRRRRDGEK